MNKPLFEITLKKKDGSFESLEEYYYFCQLPPKNLLVQIGDNVFKVLDIIFKSYPKTKSVSTKPEEKELVLAELIVEEFDMYSINSIPPKIEPRIEKTKFQSSDKLNITNK